MDVDSGSVHMVDEPAYEVLSRIETMEPDAIVAELKDRFDENDLREIIAEIDEMKQAGQLLKPSPTATAPPTCSSAFA